MIFWILAAALSIGTFFVLKTVTSWRYDKALILFTVILIFPMITGFLWGLVSTISLVVDTTEVEKSSIDMPLAPVDTQSLNGREFYLTANGDEELAELGEAFYTYVVVNEDGSLSPEGISSPKILEDEEEKPYVTYITEKTTNKDMSWLVPFFPYSEQESYYIVDYEFHIPLKGVQYSQTNGEN
jgi:hypothetical protein